jgi:hypothetical protein
MNLKKTLRIRNIQFNDSTQCVQKMKYKHKEYVPPVIVILVAIYIKQVTSFSPTGNGDSNVDIRKMSQP